MFLFLARPVVEQAVGADVDLVCAAMFLTSLYLGIVSVDSNRNRDWAMWGVSMGLSLGSKPRARLSRSAAVVAAGAGRPA